MLYVIYRLYAYENINIFADQASEKLDEAKCFQGS